MRCLSHVISTVGRLRLSAHGLSNLTMRFHSKPADKGYTFACSRKAIDTCFGRDAFEWVSFGAFSRHFEFDSRSNHRPKINGTVIAALTFCPDRHSYLCLYQVSETSYIGAGKTSFAEVVLPKLRGWLKTKLEQPETASSRHKELIVEWQKKEHLFHEFEFLLASK